MSLKIIFFGTPHFSATVLDYLLQQKANIVAVVTKSDKPKGRSGQPTPPPVKMLAEQHGIQIYQPKKASDPEFAAILKTFNADLFVVVAYSEILKENLLQMPKLGCINVHASLLPKYRGAAPIQRAIMQGEKETGVTIMSMAKELDAGDILSISKVPISEEATSGELFETLSHVGAEALWEVIEKFEKGTVQKVQQDPSQVTYAPKLTLEDGEINWDEDALIIHNQIRGTTPKPGAWCWITLRGEKKRLLIKKARADFSISNMPGKLVDEVPGLVVACRKGAIFLLEVQLEGKKIMNSEEFLRGYSKKDLSFI